MEEGTHGGDNLRQAVLPSLFPSRVVCSQAAGLSFLQAHQLHGQGQGRQGEALHHGLAFCKGERRAAFRRPPCRLPGSASGWASLTGQVLTWASPGIMTAGAEAAPIKPAIVLSVMVQSWNASTLGAEAG